jgi:hypothetical protein
MEGGRGIRHRQSYGIGPADRVVRPLQGSAKHDRRERTRSTACDSVAQRPSAQRRPYTIRCKISAAYGGTAPSRQSPLHERIAVAARADASSGRTSPPADPAPAACPCSSDVRKLCHRSRFERKTHRCPLGRKSQKCSIESVAQEKCLLSTHSRHLTVRPKRRRAAPRGRGSRPGHR